MSTVTAMKQATSVVGVVAADDEDRTEEIGRDQRPSHSAPCMPAKLNRAAKPSGNSKTAATAREPRVTIVIIGGLAQGRRSTDVRPRLSAVCMVAIELPAV